MWTKELFGVDKPVIALLHLDALPGDPLYEGNLKTVLRHASEDLNALQDGGVDGILIANEFSGPFTSQTEYVTVGTMGRIIGELIKEISVPYGVNVTMGPLATLELAAATEAKFCRSAFAGAFTGNYGLYISGDAKIIRRKKELGLDDLRLLYKCNPEGDAYLGDRDWVAVIASIAAGGWADGLCVSGSTAGNEASSDLLREAKKVSRGVPVFCNTGCNINNVREKLAIADGTCMGTGFKKDNVLTNHVDRQRVKEFMEVVKEIRAGA